MLNEHDVWPIRCPRCNQEMQEKIGTLSRAKTMNCVRCRRDFGFDSEAFSQSLAQLKKAIESGMRSINCCFKE